MDNFLRLLITLLAVSKYFTVSLHYMNIEVINRTSGLAKRATYLDNKSMEETIFQILSEHKFVRCSCSDQRSTRIIKATNDAGKELVVFCRRESTVIDSRYVATKISNRYNNKAVIKEIIL